MTNMMEALEAAGRAPDIAEESDVYGWLAGSWDLDVVRYGVDVSAEGLRGEVHFAWVLGGRAVQDVWMADLGARGKMNGTTLRVWDASIGAWRVTWIHPVTGARDELVGRRVGDDIVQIGTHANGTPIRWCFTDITPDSFRWTGEALQQDGASWKLEGEFRARRRP